MEIINLTPHSVIVVNDTGRTEYPPCRPEDLPRATEGACPAGSAVWSMDGDGQRAYETQLALAATGLVGDIAYLGVTGLPPIAPAGCAALSRCYIVSIVTVLGALAAGRCIDDMLVPTGQVRGPDGRIVGCTGLTPAPVAVGPMIRSITDGATASLITAMRRARDERDKTKAALDRALTTLRGDDRGEYEAVIAVLQA
jgi:hypothetical protein